MTVGMFEMMKLQAAVILTAATVTLALENIASAGAVECEADHQCDGGYCYLETGKCVPCVDCGWYLRQSSSWRTCARGPEDCGECLSGFEYEFLFDGSTRSFCVKKKDIKKSGILNERSPYLWIIVLTSLGLVTLVIFLVHKFYKVAKNTRRQHANLDPEDPPPTNADNENHNPPPSYDSSLPLLHQHSGISSAIVTSLTLVEKGGNTLQQAVPFSHPVPPYGTGGLVEPENEFLDPVQEDSNGPVLDSGDENEGARAISPPQLEDEDTMPSDWTPNRESNLSEEQHSEEGSSVSSSLSDISNMDDAGHSSNAQEVLNDSGVSASCSHQSDLSCVHGADGLQDLANVPETAANSICAVLQRHRSDEDLSTLSDIHERKRQRRDSGSSSMKSVETYREKV